MIAVLIADGFEEIEALTPVDMLRRAGLDVKTVAIGSKIAIGSHKIPVVCDMTKEEVELDKVSAVIFPGGMPGSLNLDASPFTDKIIEAVTKRGGHLAAICAAPMVLGHQGYLVGKRAVCFPGFEEELTGAMVDPDAFVVRDGHVITAKGMGAALDFGLTLVAALRDEQVALELRRAIMTP